MPRVVWKEFVAKLDKLGKWGLYIMASQATLHLFFLNKEVDCLHMPINSLAHCGLPHDTFTLTLQLILCSRVIVYDLDVQSLYILICVIKYGLNWIELNNLCCMYIPKTDKTTCKDMCNDQYIMHFKRRHHSITVTVLYIL